MEASRKIEGFNPRRPGRIGPTVLVVTALAAASVILSPYVAAAVILVR